MTKAAALFTCLLVAVLVCPLPAAAAASSRTFDALTDKELDKLATISRNYYTCVSSRINTITGADDSSVQGIIDTYPEHIKILRQECRINLVLVEKYLYGLTLNPEFIHNYTNTLRDDVVYFALQQRLRQAQTNQEEATDRAREQKRQMQLDALQGGAQGDGAQKPMIIPGITPPSAQQAPR